MNEIKPARVVSIGDRIYPLDRIGDREAAMFAGAAGIAIAESTPRGVTYGIAFTADDLQTLLSRELGEMAATEAEPGTVEDATQAFFQRLLDGASPEAAQALHDQVDPLLNAIGPQQTLLVLAKVFGAAGDSPAG